MLKHATSPTRLAHGDYVALNVINFRDGTGANDIGISYRSGPYRCGAERTHRQAALQKTLTSNNGAPSDQNSYGVAAVMVLVKRYSTEWIVTQPLAE